MMNKWNIMGIIWSLVLGTQCITAMEIASRPTKSVTCNAPSKFDILPKEITHIIIRKLYDIPETIAVATSIEYAIHYYSSIKKICPLRIGNKIYTADDLLLLKPKEKEDLIAVANPSYLQQTKGFSPSLVSQRTAQKIEQLPEHIRKNLHVNVFHKNPNEYSDKEITCIVCTGIACAVCAGCIAPTYVSSFGNFVFFYLTGSGISCCCLRCTPCSHKISGSPDEIYTHKKRY